MSVHAVILAGGSGTRLWPLSTRKLSKQFLRVGSRESLIFQTWQRLEGAVSPDRCWVVCGRDHASEVKRHLPRILPDHILSEPQAKNTAPALALAAVELKRRDPEALMFVLPADHYIPQEDWPMFQKTLHLAGEVARREKALITLGVAPTEAAIGYGYLETGRKFHRDGSAYFSVQRFHEKPDLLRAREYLSGGNFFWNSGMFIWEVDVFLAELEKTAPELFKLFQEPSDSLEKIFDKAEAISVDYAVMEKSKKVFMIPAEFRWDDVGSLLSFDKVLSPDEAGNRSEGICIAVEAKGNTALGSSKPVAFLGVNDLLVVETPEALLVLPKGRAQEVKAVVEKIKQKGRKELL